MSLTQPLLEAAALLDVDVDAEPRALRRAYRRAVRNHPPDRDPEGFARIRAAYELLDGSLEWVSTALVQRYPAGPVPELPSPAARGSTIVAVFRDAVGRLPTKELMEELP